MSLGSRVRKRREALGLAPIEAAVRAGFSEIYWRQIEGGQRRPQKHTSLQRIAHALDWTISDLTDADHASTSGRTA
jgi:transcriptional regulator with XRE-family HTH domain